MRLYQAFMQNVTLRRSIFTPTSGNDHEHCVMCGIRFSAQPEDLQNGYVTFDNRHRVCPEFLNEYKTEYRWTVAN